MNKWKEIWNKDKSLDGSNVLEGLIKADGFDSGAGRIDASDWLEYIEFIADKTLLQTEESIFEVGCGSGAFLYPFYSQGHAVGGIDYSHTLIRIAREVMPKADFSVSEAISLETEAKFDVVLSNSCFHYFSDLNYAEKIVNAMFTKARKTVAILEIPDLATKAQSEQARASLLPEGEYENKYKGLEHLYYDKKWFKELAQKHGADVEIFGQQISNYGNNNFRYNVVFKKW